LSKLNSHHSARPLTREPSIYGIHETSTTYQYSVLITNCYTALSSYQELKPISEIIPPPNDKYPPRSIVTQKRKHTTRSPKRKQTKIYHHGPTRTSPSNKHNLQERRRSDNEDNEDGETNYIPTVINGVTNDSYVYVIVKSKEQSIDS